jgi:hypothetical protein
VSAVVRPVVSLSPSVRHRWGEVLLDVDRSGTGKPQIHAMALSDPSISKSRRCEGFNTVFTMYNEKSLFANCKLNNVDLIETGGGHRFAHPQRLAPPVCRATLVQIRIRYVFDVWLLFHLYIRSLYPSSHSFAAFNYMYGIRLLTSDNVICILVVSLVDRRRSPRLEVFRNRLKSWKFLRVFFATCRWLKCV